MFLICPAHTAWGRSPGLSDLVIHSFSITQCCQPSRYQNIAPCQLDLDRSQGQGWPHVADDSKWGEQNLWHGLTCSNNKPLVESSPPDSYQAQLAHFRKEILSVGRWSWGWLPVTYILGSPFKFKELWGFHFLLVFFSVSPSFVSRQSSHLLPVFRIHPFIYSPARRCVLSIVACTMEKKVEI